MRVVRVAEYSSPSGLTLCFAQDLMLKVYRPRFSFFFFFSFYKQSLRRNLASNPFGVEASDWLTVKQSIVSSSFLLRNRAPVRQHASGDADRKDQPVDF